MVTTRPDEVPTASPAPPVKMYARSVLARGIDRDRPVRERAFGGPFASMPMVAVGAGDGLTTSDDPHGPLRRSHPTRFSNSEGAGQRGGGSPKTNRQRPDRTMSTRRPNVREIR
jgi:hypothetical protein